MDDKPNFRLFFVSKDESEENFRFSFGDRVRSTGLCFGTTWRPSPKSGEIENVLISIRNDLSLALTRSCIVEDMTKALGLPNDVVGDVPTMFNDRNQLS